MADQDPSPQLAQGQLEEQRLRAGGFGDEEITNWKTETSDKLAKAGFAPEEVQDYFGVNRNPDTSAMKDLAKSAIQAHLDEKNKDAEGKPKDPGVDSIQGEGFIDAVKASFGHSVTGMALLGKPTLAAPTDLPFLEDLVAKVPGLIGDAPAFVAGMVAAGGPARPKAAMAAGFAAPAAIRKILMDHYQKGDITDAHDFATRFAATTWEAAKQAGLGVAVAITGGSATPLLAGAAEKMGAETLAQGISGPTGQAITKLGAEAATLTVAGSALEGRLPNFRDFAQNAMLMGGIHASISVAPKLMNIYKATGELPQEIAQKAATDVNLKEELMSESPELPKLPDGRPLTEANAKEENSIPDKTPESPASSGDGGNEPPQGPPSENAPTPLSDAEKEILGKVENENPEAPKETVGQRLKRWKIDNIDAYAALKDAGAKTAYKAARTFNGVGDAIDSITLDATRDFHTGEENGEAPAKVLQEAEAKNNDPGAQRLKAFMVAETSLERDARGVESIFETKEQKANAEKLVADGQEKYGEYSKRFNDSANRVLKYFTDSGMITQESYDKITEANKTHLPLNTVQEVDPLTGKIRTGTGDIVVKKAVGSLDDKLDPFDQAFKNMQRMIEVAEKNRVRNIMRDELGPEIDKVLRVKEGGGQVVTIENPLSENPLTTYVPEAADVDENSFPIYKDGKRTVYEGNPNVIKAMKALDGDHMALPLWAKVMKNWSSTLRFGTLLNPDFAGFHYFRSQTSAGLYSKTGMWPFIEPLYNMKDFITKPQVYKDFLYDGAGVTLRERISDNFLNEKVFKAVENEDGTYEFKDPAFMKRAWSYMSLDGAKDAAKTAATALFHLNEAMISATDNAARYTEYKRAREMGVDRDEAAFMGRNVTADYQRAGATRSALRSAIAFSNVHLQVMDRAFEEAADPETRLAFGAKLAAKIAVPSLLLAAAFHDDPRYKELPWHQKMLFFNFPIDHWTEDKSGETYGNADEQLRKKDEQGRMFVNDGPVMKVPVPGEPGIIFGTGLAATLMGFIDKDPRAGKEAARQILSNSVFLPIPNAVVAPLEHMTNYNFFTGRQVVNAQKEKQLPFEQYNEYSTDLARTLGKYVGYVPWIGNTSMASPMVIDNYIRDWTGGGGAIAVQYLDSALRKAGIAPDKVVPEKSTTESPLLRGFFTQYPNMNAQSIQDFHDRFQKASQIEETMKTQAKAGDFSGRAQTMAQYGPEMEKVKGINTALRTADKFVQMILADNSMSPEDKRKLITTTTYQKIQAARMGNQIMDNFEKSMKANNNAGE